VTAVLEGPRTAALRLADGAKDAAELRVWLEMIGLPPEPEPVTEEEPELDPATEKLCIGCDTVKPLSGFYVTRKTGNPMSYCKTCSTAKARQWRQENGAARHSQQQRDYRARLNAIGVEVPRGQYAVALAVRVGEALADALKAEAAAAGVTVTEHIRGILRDHCDSQTAAKQGAA
jgi:predicted HicB family RNase H-like nuclease